MLEQMVHLGRWTLVLSGIAAMLASPSFAATFLGLDTATQDQIDRVGFEITAGNGTYTDSLDQLDFTANATNIDAAPTAPPGPSTTRLEIGGAPGGGTPGSVIVHTDLASENLAFLFNAGPGDDFFQYDATLVGRAGVDDITLTSAIGGGAPEQDGRTLITGEIIGTVAISITFSSLSGPFGTPAVTGSFSVNGGDDATFESIFGGTGDMADIFAALISSSPPTAALISDGFMFSTRDDGAGGSLLTACAAGITCTGAVTGQDDFTFAGNGEITPNNAAPFVPEPGTGLLVSLGLVGLAIRRRSA